MVLCPLGTAPSRCWQKAFNRPVLKHGPRSLTCMRAGGFECEHTCWDPKDGELCLSRVKPEETLVEARRCADVQIAFRTWV
ncbi:hypothetical protein V8C86DRAFT_1802993 [Haematococcus lacustris]